MNQPSFYQQLLKIGSVLLLIPFAFLPFIHVWSTWSLLQQEKTDFLRHVLRSEEQAIENWVHQNSDILHFAAFNPLLRRGDIATAALLLSDLAEHLADCDHILYVDKTGQLLFSTLPTSPPDITAEGWFQSALSGEETIVGPLPGKRTSLPTLGFTHPVFAPDGTVTAVLYVAFHIDSLTAVVDQFQPGLTGRTFLLDTTSHQPISALRISRDALATIGQSAAWGDIEVRRPIRDGRWTLIGQFSHTETLQPLLDRLPSWILFTAVSLFLSVALLRRFSQQVTQPLEQLSAIAAAVLQGDWERRGPITPAENTAKEIQLLDNTFNKMLDHLNTNMAILSETNRKLEQYRLLVEHSRDAILFIDADTLTIGEANAAAVSLYGYEREELIGMPLNQIRAESSFSPVVQALEGHPDLCWRYETHHYHKDGTSFPVEVSIQKQALGDHYWYMSIIRDTTQRKELEANLRYRSLHDSLTGLLNRSAYDQLVSQQDSPPLPTAAMVIDVDGLKLINDLAGHAAGDMLLQSAAQVISSVLPAGAKLYRVGGDEFALFFPDTDEASTTALQSRILEARQQFCASQPLVPLHFSIGLAVATLPPVNLGDLFRLADDRMYLLKGASRAQVRHEIFIALISAWVIDAPLMTTQIRRLELLAEQFGEFMGLTPWDRYPLRRLARLHDLCRAVVANGLLASILKEAQQRSLESDIDGVNWQLVYEVLSHYQQQGGVQGWIASCPILSGTSPILSQILCLLDLYEDWVGERTGISPAEQFPAYVQAATANWLDPEIASSFIDFWHQHLQHQPSSPPSTM